MGTNWVKPQAGTDIDPAHPLASKLIIALAFNKGAGLVVDNLAAADSLTLQTAHTWTDTTQGKAVTWPGVGSTGNASIPASLAYRPAGGFSMAVRVRFTSITAAEQALIRVDDGSTNRIGLISLNPTTAQMRCLGFTSTATPTATGTTVCTAGPWYDVVGTFDGVNSRIYVNGLLEATSTNATGTLYRGSAAVAAGIGSFNTQTPLIGTLAHAFMWGGRILTADEVLSLYVNPWAIFRSPPSWGDGILATFGSAAKTPARLTAAAGSFALSGQPASLNAGRKLTSAAGAFALSGQPATLKPARSLTAAAGTFSQAGQPATLRATRTLTATAGAFSEAGQPASLKAGRKVTAAAGSFTETGVAATLRLVRSVTAAAGSFTETGQAAGLLTTRKLTAAAGTFVETGQPAGLKAARKLTSAAGAFSEAGQSAGLKVGRKLTSAAGAFVVSGQPVNFLSTRRIIAAAGSFSETGVAAGLKAARKLAASAGSFAISGQAAALTYGAVGHYTFAATAGAFAVSGQPAGLKAARSVTAAAGSFIESGQAASLKAARRLSATPGAYAVTGIAATLTYTSVGHFTVTAAAGSFALTGRAASLPAARRLVATPGPLVITGVAAALTYTPTAGGGIGVSGGMRRGGAATVPLTSFTLLIASDITTTVRNADLEVAWRTSFPPGTYYQVYVDGVRAWTGTATSALFPLPSSRVQFSVGAMPAALAGNDYSARVPAPLKRKILLTWYGGRYLGEDISSYRVYLGDAPGLPVDYTRPVATIPAYAGPTTDGFGRGGFGRGGFGTAATHYRWESNELAAGTWDVGVTSVDLWGNESDPTIATVTVTGPPEPPALSDDGLRLHYSYDAIAHTVNLVWLPSPSA